MRLYAVQPQFLLSYSQWTRSSRIIFVLYIIYNYNIQRFEYVQKKRSTSSKCINTKFCITGSIYIFIFSKPTESRSIFRFLVFELFINLIKTSYITLLRLYRHSRFIRPKLKAFRSSVLWHHDVLVRCFSMSSCYRFYSRLYSSSCVYR